MGGTTAPSVEQVFREEWSRAVSILIRVLGDFELAEDAVQDAFATALERWERDGVPQNPGAWIVTAARNRAIDRIRREQTFARKAELLARLDDLPEEEGDVSAIPDDRLALVFTCCHPALAAEAQVALTLREVGGLTTTEIARAFLVADGPYAETREVLGGYFLLECDTIDDAVEWAARIPAAERGAVEVRPVYVDHTEA